MRNNIPAAKTTQKVITSPDVAENGDIKNYDNDGDGRTESVNVRGYFNKNSTYEEVITEPKESKSILLMDKKYPSVG